MASICRAHGQSKQHCNSADDASNHSRQTACKPAWTAGRTIMSLVSASMAEARSRFSAVVPTRSTVPLWHTATDGSAGQLGWVPKRVAGTGAAQAAHQAACAAAGMHTLGAAQELCTHWWTPGGRRGPAGCGPTGSAPPTAARNSEGAPKGHDISTPQPSTRPCLASKHSKHEQPPP